VGGFAVLLASIPASFSDLNVSFTNNLDRFTLPGSFGACLLLVGILFAVGKAPVRRWVPALLLLAAVMTHHINGINFADEWEKSRVLWWQLSWRAPGIEPGTMLLADFTQLPSGYSSWPASLIYYPQPGPLRVASEVLNTSTSQFLLDGRSISRNNRSFELVYNYGKVLVLSKPSPDSCLQIMDGSAPEFSGSENFRIMSIAASSDLNRINVHAEPSTPPVSLFGPEPPRDWCYYYQLASLARQQGDWQEVAKLGMETAGKDLRPVDRVEWLPFLYGYAYTGDYDRASGIVSIVAEVLRVKASVCTNLNLEAQTSSAAEDPQITAGREFLLTKLCN
jgi:hypothetical protein